MYEFRSEEFFVMNHNELQEIILAQYGQKYDIPNGEEIHNDSYMVPHVNRGNVLPNYDQRYLDEFEKTGQGMSLLYIFMQDLCSRGVIPEGRYVIEISW